MGFVTFFGTIIVILYLLIRQAYKVTDPILKAFVFGFIAGSLGLLINAFYIDVFEASKVATMYWALAGIAMAIPLVAIGNVKGAK